MELPVTDFEDIQVLRGPLVPILLSLAIFPIGWMFGYAIFGAVIASIFVLVCAITAYCDGVGKRGVRFSRNELTLFTPKHGSTMVNLAEISDYKFKISTSEQLDILSARVVFEFNLSLIHI